MGEVRTVVGFGGFRDSGGRPDQVALIRRNNAGL